ncbi:arylamine N-acetyltransferase family protein [Aspergillus stella-maris]|uniref:arylamine N-acetyltransferase family protein n=1 Tax=Aspergillus stella-maris TaxID=1810926 RepID=UPI003CCCDB7F
MAVYTESQLQTYLSRIKYPSQQDPLSNLKSFIATNPLQALTTLQRHHLSSIPWGNTALHYSQHHSISTHPSAVFEKLVNGRLDGYCMENTNLLYGILRSLGYVIYPAAGRVSKSVGDASVKGRDVRFGSLGHMVLIVTINGEKYMVDVGFGNNNPTSPLPLQSNTTAKNHPGTLMRLIKEPLPEAVDQSQKFWMYQVSYTTTPTQETDWQTMYAFSEAETLPQDFEMMNVNTSQTASSWFTQTVVCVKHVFEEEDLDGELRAVGMYVLTGREVKSRIGGVSEVVMKLENEGDRIEALERWFGVELADYEVQGIKGLGSELV